MAFRIAIIGLDTLGVSMALALHARSDEIQCYGWDADLEKRIESDKTGAFRSVPKKMKDVLPDAALVILNQPPEGFKDILNEIKSSLSPDTVLVNVSRLHVLPDNWVKETLGSDTQFVSILPALNPAGVMETEAAGAELFAGGVAMVTMPAWTDPSALDVAVDLAVLLGSMPVFADAYEVDGLSAANLILPELAASALMSAVSGQPSWRDGKLLAGGVLNQATALLEGTESTAVAQTAFANRENVIRLLDDLTEELQRTKRALEAADSQALEALLAQTAKARADWLKAWRQPVGGKNVTSSIPTEKYALERLLKRAA